MQSRPSPRQAVLVKDDAELRINIAAPCAADSPAGPTLSPAKALQRLNSYRQAKHLNVHKVLKTVLLCGLTLVVIVSGIFSWKTQSTTIHVGSGTGVLVSAASSSLGAQSPAGKSRFNSSALETAYRVVVSKQQSNPSEQQGTQHGFQPTPIIHQVRFLKCQSRGTRRYLIYVQFMAECVD